MVKKILYTALASCLLISDIQPTLVIGDPDATAGNTFSFNIGHAAYIYNDKAPSKLWLASNENITSDAAKPYALSYVLQLPAEPMVYPATNEVIVPTAIPMANSENAFVFTLNPTTDLVETTSIANPIYGKAFSFFDTSNAKPAFVMASDLNKLYYTYDIERYPVQTKEQFNKTELLLYDLGAGQETKAFIGSEGYIYAAYANGTFGTATSKIAAFVANSKVQKIPMKPQPYLQLVAQETVSTATPALLGGGANLAALGSSITFGHFFKSTKIAIYAGLQATASAGNKAAGAMIVNIVKTEQVNSLVFDSIADDAVISSSVNTVISAKGGVTIRIKNIAPMMTSTSLSYLIVARDNGTGPQSIYAAPLVSTGSNIGKIADATSVTTTFNANPTSYSSRNFTKLLTDPTQIDIESATEFSDQIKVGTGAIPLASGDIKDLYTIGDSVYVVIGSDYASGTEPGTFYSQAIFAQDGHIINWTPWSRVMGSDSPMNFSYMNPRSTVNFYVASTDNGAGFKQVIHTQWNTNLNLSIMFAPPYMAKGGTQGIFNFGQSTPGFNDALSLLITTGYNNVTIGQTGYLKAPSEFAIKTMATSDIVSFDDVDGSKSLIAAELAHNDNNHWLFAGGASGLFVLSGDNTGYTWTGNLASVSGFDDGQTWKTVGNFSYIKKLVWDTTFLYVLTPTALYQIELDPSKFTKTPTSDLNPFTILTLKDLAGKPFLLDLIIDNGFCILGTTNGIFSFDASSGKPTSYIKIPIPDGLPAATQLITTSSSSTPQRSFKSQSNVLVLNNTFETQQAQLNRFVITDGVITPFDDALFNSPEEPNGIPTSFIKFNQYYSNYYTNGSWNLASNYFLGTTQPSSVTSASMLQFYAGITNGKSSSHYIYPNWNAPVPTKFLTGTNLFLGVIRESTSGAFVAPGSFMARINA